MSEATAVPRYPARGADAVTPAINDRREIFGWTMYDWANSAFSTTVGGVLLAPYVTTLAQNAVGDNGVVLAIGPLTLITAKSLWPFTTSASVLLQVFFLPLLGAVADYTNLKKRLMLVFTYIAVAAVCLLFFVANGLYLLGALLFIVANVSFGGAIVMYNAYLPEITTEDQRDKVSSRGFALGYLGGGLLLAANLALVILKPFGLSSGWAVRLSLLSAGVWWGGFAVITFLRLRVRESARSLPPGKNLLTVGFGELRQSFGELRRLPQTLRYLIGYLFYNDGIQTVISLASVFLTQELFVAKGRSEDDAQSFVIGVYLMVQFVAFGGALFFGCLAQCVGSKRAIVVSLVLWTGVVVYAYGLLQTTLQAWFMAAVIAIVLGGSQALSRSLFSRMIPAGREASFFGIYEISERGTSWIGPLIFGIVVGRTGSYRDAILSLIILFGVGLLILALTDTDRAIHEAGQETPEEAASHVFAG
jgi:UMF1 family MFS transporter